MEGYFMGVMRLLKSGLIGVGFASAMVIGGISYGEAVEIKQKWEPGKKYIMKQVANVEMVMPMPQIEGGAKTTSDVEQVFSQTVSEHSKGSVAKLSFDKFKMSTIMNGNPLMELDSEKEADLKGPMAGVISGVLGTSVDAVYDDDGNFIEITNFKSGGALAAQIFNEDVIKQMVEAGTKFLPKGKVSPGDTWKVDYQFAMPPMGDMATTMNITLDSVKGDIASMSFTGDMKLAEGAGGPGISMKTDKFTGTMDFDIKRGVQVKSKTIMNLTMLPPAEALGDQVPAEMPIKSTTIQTLVDIVDAK